MKKSIIALSLLSVLSFSAASADFKINVTQDHAGVVKNKDGSFSVKKDYLTKELNSAQKTFDVANEALVKAKTTDTYLSADGKTKLTFDKIEAKYDATAKSVESKQRNKISDAQLALDKADIAAKNAKSDLESAKVGAANAITPDEIKAASKNLAKAEKALDAAIKESDTKKAAVEAVKDAARKAIASVAETKEGKAFTAAKTVVDTKNADLVAAKKSVDSIKTDRDEAGKVVSYNTAVTAETTTNSAIHTVAKQATTGINANTDRIEKVSSTLVSHDTRISTNAKNITSNTNRIANIEGDVKNLRQDFEKLSKDYNSFKKTASAGIAGVAAMANIPTAYGVGNVAVGAGIGSFNGEQAISVGVSYRANEAIAMKASIAANSGSNVEPVIGAGISYEF